MGFICVDDTDLTVIVREDKNVDDVIHRQQQGTLYWNFLEVTGRFLKLVKEYCYLIDFLWKDEEWGYIITVNSECRILGDKDTDHIIKSLPVEDPKQIMEIWQHLMGDNTRQINRIIEKHKSMINKVKSSEFDTDFHCIQLQWKKANKSSVNLLGLSSTQWVSTEISQERW